MSGYYDRQGRQRDYTDVLHSEILPAQDRGEDYHRVAWTDLDDQEVCVSTVWLGLDHQHGNGLPLIFETMVFGGFLNERMERYSTETEALEGHEEMVALAQTVHATEQSMSDDPLIAGAQRAIVDRISQLLHHHLSNVATADVAARLLKKVQL